jgi:DNA-binding transcriptional MerR regulator/methylmalonyl-CoA mutase cobalamin-binding subunit
MYTIKQAAARSGLSVATVRVWERRYGVVHPERTASGYRLYDDDAIDRLTAMRHLVEDDGVRPSQAAEVVAAAGADLSSILAAAAAAAGNAAADAPTSASPRHSGDLVEAFIAAAQELDVVAMEGTLDEAFAGERFEAAAGHVVFPALRAIGERWSAGELDVAMEHAASETIRSRLGRFLDAASAGGEPDVVVGLPPGARHEIGAAAFVIAARRRGLEVLYLGADVPVASWLATVGVTGARLAVIGVTGAPDVAAAAEVVAALRASSRPPALALGGRRAAEVAVGPGVLVLPDDLDAAVTAARRLLEPAS